MNSTLAGVSGNFWLCGTSRTNKYLLFCGFMYFKFYVKILGDRMFVVGSFQTHMRTRIQDQDLLGTALLRDLRMVQVCSSRL